MYKSFSCIFSWEVDRFTKTKMILGSFCTCRQIHLISENVKLFWCLSVTYPSFCPPVCLTVMLKPSLGPTHLADVLFDDRRHWLPWWRPAPVCLWPVERTHQVQRTTGDYSLRHLLLSLNGALSFCYQIYLLQRFWLLDVLYIIISSLFEYLRASVSANVLYYLVELVTLLVVTVNRMSMLLGSTSRAGSNTLHSPGSCWCRRDWNSRCWWRGSPSSVRVIETWLLYNAGWT